VSVAPLAKACHECTRELLGFGLTSILLLQVLTRILTGLTYEETQTLGSSTCTSQVTHHGSESLEYPQVPISTRGYLQPVHTN